VRGNNVLLIDRDRPFHVAVFDTVLAYLATRGIDLAQLSEQGGRTSGTFTQGGKRYRFTIAEDPEPSGAPK
jgi:hypothetical protein